MGITPMPVISRGVPAYANDNDFNVYPQANANDSDYGSVWRTQDLSSIGNVAYLAYDLSGVASASRKQVALVWYNNYTPDYDFNVNGGVYNQPSDYTIDANSAAGGSLPGSGWTTLATVTGNIYHSRQHSIDLTGFNWIRINCTAINGAVFNLGCSLQMDVHNAAAGITDDWIFYGDSITANGAQVNDAYGVGTIAQLINAGVPNFPLIEDGGIGGRTSAFGAANISTWLPLFPGKWVALSYGTNDATAAVAPSTFQTNMQTMINAAKGQGCNVVIPHIPWGANGGIQANAPALNTVIDNLIAADPTHVFSGPDLWAYYQANPSLISGDQVHPTDAGYAGYRQQWANALLATIYANTQDPNLAAFDAYHFGRAV